MLSLESAVFLLATLLNAYVINSSLPKSALFIFLSILLAVLLVFFNRFSFTFLQQKEHKPFLLIALFLSSFFVQLLVIATGGLFSAFVIALHLFTLATSVLFQVSSAIVFLLLSVGLLMSTIFFDPQMKLLFQNDPWSVVLHGISFLVIIPLAHMLVSTYHLKDAISKMLTENLKTKELQDESIFRGIGEMVFIADKNLKIVFANEAAKRTLGLESKQIIATDLLSSVPLISRENQPATSQTLSVDASISDRQVHLVKGFFLQAQKNKLPVVAQIRPIFETAEKNNQLKQLILVLTPDHLGFNPDEIDIQMAYSHSAQLATELERELESHSDNSKEELTLLMAQINDLMLFQKITSHGITTHKVPTNMTELLRTCVQSNQKFFAALKIIPDFRETQVDLVRTSNEEHNSSYSLYSHLKSNTLRNLDPDWTSKMLVQLLKLFTLVSQSNKEKKVAFRIGYNDGDELIILLSTQTDAEIGTKYDQLIIQNYGSLAHHQSLQQGSGIEGTLAQKIAQLLNLSFTFHFDSVSNYLYCNVVLPIDNTPDPIKQQ